MAKSTLSFEDFIAIVDTQNIDFVTGLHKIFLDKGCKIEVKEAKNGYLVSYILNKKSVANYIFRKKGIIIRIYANNILNYMGILDSFPENMQESIKNAQDCKRLINPTDCNPKCSMGYDFLMSGKRYQKCRSCAFMFLLTSENNPFIKNFIIGELA